MAVGDLPTSTNAAVVFTQSNETPYGCVCHTNQQYSAGKRYP